MKLVDKIDYLVYLAAYREDPEKTEETVSSMQDAWDAGESFLPGLESLLFGKRMEDSEEEVKAAAELLTVKLAVIAMDGAIENTLRENMVAMLNFMASMSPAGTLLAYGQEWTVDELLSKWNGLHPEEPAIVRGDHWEN